MFHSILVHVFNTRTNKYVVCVSDFISLQGRWCLTPLSAYLSYIVAVLHYRNTALVKGNSVFICTNRGVKTTVVFLHCKENISFQYFEFSPFLLNLECMFISHAQKTTLNHNIQFLLPIILQSLQIYITYILLMELQIKIRLEAYFKSYICAFYITKNIFLTIFQIKDSITQ